MKRIVVTILVVCCAFAVPAAIEGQAKKTAPAKEAAPAGKVEIVQNKNGFRSRVDNAATCSSLPVR